MFEQLIALLTRFVVAVEIIAKSSGTAEVKVTTTAAKENKAGDKSEDKAETETTKKTTRGRGRPAKNDDAVEDQEEKKTSTRGKSRTTKAKANPETAKLRAEVKELAELMCSDDTDDADKIQDAFDDVLEDFNVASVAKVSDDDLEEFHAKLKEAAEEFFNLDDDA